MNENSKSTTRFALDGLPRTAAQTRALKHRLGQLDVRATNYKDVPQLPDEWFLRAAREGRLASPLAKKPISIKLDQDVLDYFKGEGTRYQTHINAVLRAYMLARRLAGTSV